MTSAITKGGTWSRRRLVAALALLPMAVPAMAAVPRQHQVEVRGLAFAPEVLEVRPGDSITWTNRDIAPHTATAKDGSWDSGPLEKGQGWTLRVTEEIEPAYVCLYHPHMTAALSLG